MDLFQGYWISTVQRWPKKFFFHNLFDNWFKPVVFWNKWADKLFKKEVNDTVFRHAPCNIVLWENKIGSCTTESALLACTEILLIDWHQ